MFEIHTVFYLYINIHKCVFFGCLPPINHSVKLVPVLHVFPKLQVCMVNGIEEGSLIGVWNSISTIQKWWLGPMFFVSVEEILYHLGCIKINLKNWESYQLVYWIFCHWDKESQINHHLVAGISSSRHKTRQVRTSLVHSWRMWIYHPMFFCWQPWKERLEWRAKIFEEPPEFPKSNGVVAQFAVIGSGVLAGKHRSF